MRHDRRIASISDVGSRRGILWFTWRFVGFTTGILVRTFIHQVPVDPAEAVDHLLHRRAEAGGSLIVVEELERETSKMEEVEFGDKVRQFMGEGNRQYLTGLVLGGERVMILVDGCASMLADTVVNAVRRRSRRFRHR